jgi:hypothetical protein
MLIKQRKEAFMFPIRWTTVFVAGVLAAAIFAAPASAYMDHVPRMDKEALKAMLDSPDLVLLDIRGGQDWAASEIKIKGAQRRDPRDFNAWKDQLPRDKTLVLYCA